MILVKILQYLTFQYISRKTAFHRPNFPENTILLVEFLKRNTFKSSKKTISIVKIFQKKAEKDTTSLVKVPLKL